jgi:hypothetical protein
MAENSRMFIEAFEGPKGRSEVFEVLGKDASGIELVTYEVNFNGQLQHVQSMGEASILASELAGDPRFKGNR